MRKPASCQLYHRLEQLEGRTFLTASPVSITVVHNASESGPTDGIFRITRAASNADLALTVTLRVGGTATYGTDYSLPTAPADSRITVTIPAHEQSTLLATTPIDDTVVDPGETVQITAITSTGTAYDPGASASLIIEDNDQADTTAPVSITAVSNGSENGPTNGVFRITRTSSSRDAALSVTLRVAGTATYGSDYTLATAPVDNRITVTIPAHELSTLLTVTPIDDSVVDPSETVVFTAVNSNGQTYNPSASAHLTIIDNDSPTTYTPPIASANGSYRVTEGRSETLHGTATAAEGRSISFYQWDFSYDGSTFNVDATGASPKFSAAKLDGTQAGVTRTIALRVLDSAGTVSAISTTTIRIVNAPPTARLVGSTVKRGNDATVQFVDISDVPADKEAGFTYRYDFDNDGIVDLATHRSGAVVPASYLTTVGTHTISASIRDKDSGVSTYTAKVIVTAATEHSQPVAKFSNATIAGLDKTFNGLDVDDIVGSLAV